MTEKKVEYNVKKNEEPITFVLGFYHNYHNYVGVGGKTKDHDKDGRKYVHFSHTNSAKGYHGPCVFIRLDNWRHLPNDLKDAFRQEINVRQATGELVDVLYDYTI